MASSEITNNNNNQQTTTKETETDDDLLCTICQDQVTYPIRLPCGHKYCTNCLEDWKSNHKFNDAHKKCPDCRSVIPPSKDLMSQYTDMKIILADLQARLSSSEPLVLTDPSIKSYIPEIGQQMIHKLPSDEQQRCIRAKIEGFVQEYKEQIVDPFEMVYGPDYDGPILDENSNIMKDYTTIPDDVESAIERNDWQVLINWLGYPPNVHPERIHSYKWCAERKFDLLLQVICMLTLSSREENFHVVPYLLQNGFDMNHPKLEFAGNFVWILLAPDKFDIPIRVLLQWGVKIDKKLYKQCFESPKYKGCMGNPELWKHTMKYPLGGRRCEIVGLKKRPELNGITGVAGRYISKEDRYEFTIEFGDSRGEQVNVRSINLRRRDRTTDDIGYYMYKWDEEKCKIVKEINPQYLP